MRAFVDQLLMNMVRVIGFLILSAAMAGCFASLFAVMGFALELVKDEPQIPGYAALLGLVYLGFVVTAVQRGWLTKAADFLGP